mmetsp:Transcript_16974/g.12143  ORF Transcript_16974/g.12143 Transcript_16974/m.12143 type:complete len:118 (-) Transcript_16974:444-797(-)
MEILYLKRAGCCKMWKKQSQAIILLKLRENKGIVDPERENLVFKVSLEKLVKHTEKIKVELIHRLYVKNLGSTIVKDWEQQTTIETPIWEYHINSVNQNNYDLEVNLKDLQDSINSN